MKPFVSITHSIIVLILLAVSLTTHAEVGELSVSSDAFEHKGKLPKIYTCNGKDISPPLTISNIPDNAKTLVLIHDDPDAPRGTWDHWLLYDIPVTGTSMTLAEAASKNKKSVWADGTMQGKNSWGSAKYGGACPPSGSHRYFFKVYALDSALNLKKKRNKRKIEKAMKKHIIAKGELMAKYP